MDERGLVLRFQDSVLFEKSKADILSQTLGALKEIAKILKTTDNPIRIEGHTDDLPINTVKYPSNWELSTTRATNVLRFLIQEGLPGNRLSAVGYGEFRPLVPNDSEENRKKNRRVDLVLIRKDLIVNEPK
jgi:chemotaxis protein MotB